MTLLEIVQAIQPKIEAIPIAHAMWLEGSYATGKFRDDSDIDVWVDVDDEAFEEVFLAFKQTLEGLNLLDRLDPLREYSNDPKLAKAKFYLTGKSDDQRIELDIQAHSRKFIFDQVKHTIVVLFDKDNTIRWKL